MQNLVKSRSIACNEDLFVTYRTVMFSSPANTHSLRLNVSSAVFSYSTSHTFCHALLSAANKGLLDSY